MDIFPKVWDSGSSVIGASVVMCSGPESSIDSGIGIDSKSAIVSDSAIAFNCASASMTLRTKSFV